MTLFPRPSPLGRRRKHEAIKENSYKLTKLQKAIDDLLSATSVPEESLDAVPFAEMTFTMKGAHN